jgi:hypothetical protein
VNSFIVNSFIVNDRRRLLGIAPGACTAAG